MRKLIVACFAFLVWASGAQAQWVVEGEGGAARNAAQVCTEGQTGLCFELACEAGGPLTWGLSSETMIDMMAAPRVRALIFVGSRLSGEVTFEQTSPGVFSAPMEQAHEEGIERLKAGAQAELRLWFDINSPPEIVRLGLRGSRNALTAVEEACARPDYAAQEVAKKTSDNPLIDILGDMKEACDALGGQLTPLEGLAEAVDLDGQDPIDMRVNHAKAECSTTSSLVCGSAGCVTSLWLGLEGGDYRQVFEGNVYGMSLPQPGVVEMDLHGSACGKAGSAPCKKRFALVGETLEPLAD